MLSVNYRSNCLKALFHNHLMGNKLVNVDLPEVKMQLKNDGMTYSSLSGTASTREGLLLAAEVHNLFIIHQEPLRLLFGLYSRNTLAAQVCNSLMSQIFDGDHMKSHMGFSVEIKGDKLFHGAALTGHFRVRIESSSDPIQSIANAFFRTFPFLLGFSDANHALCPEMNNFSRDSLVQATCEENLRCKDICHIISYQRTHSIFQ